MLRNKLVALFVCIGTSFAWPQDTATSIDAPQSTDAIRELESTHYSNYSSHASITEMAEQPECQKKGTVTVVQSTIPHNRMGSGSTDPFDWLHGLALNSEAVIIGHPVAESSALTAEHTFVFTDNDFEVERVFKDTRGVLRNGSRIVVTRPGGTFAYKGLTLTAVEVELPTFTLGQRYLIFLHRLPDTGTYGVHGVAAYSLQNGLASSIARHPKHLQGAMDEWSFLSQLERFTSQEADGR